MNSIKPIVQPQQCTKEADDKNADEQEQKKHTSLFYSWDKLIYWPSADRVKQNQSPTSSIIIKKKNREITITCEV